MIFIVKINFVLGTQISFPSKIGLIGIIFKIHKNFVLALAVLSILVFTYTAPAVT